MNATDAVPPWVALLKRLAIWGGFFFLIYLTRDFFFLAFMTFMFSYLALNVGGWGMRRLSPHAEKPGLRRLLTLAVFILGPLTLLGVGALVMPRLVEQAERFAGWVSNLNPEAEVAHLLEGYVGRSAFAKEYGNPHDERYRKALDEYRATGARHVAAYQQFPKLEAWVEGGFAKQFAEAERGRVRHRLATEGTSSRKFERWFAEVKVPQLTAEDRKGGAEAALQQVRHDPVALSRLRTEWIDDAAARAVTAAKSSPAYPEQFRADYETRREQSPETVPYTFDQYEALQKARAQGPKAFGDAIAALHAGTVADGESQLQADFEATKRHELFQAWWATSSPAKFIRQRLETVGNGDATARVERMLASLLNVPLDLISALLLSFFICIDFPALRRATRQLRDTWLRDVYDEMAPALTSLALLIGRAMQAQGLIAACNATLIFLALSALGVEHAVLLGGAVFVFCLVPTIGMILAWVLLAAVALVQPGGGFALAAKVSAAVVVAVLMETFVFSPRILGKLMELHPVLIFAILPLGQYFFGVWGLILATPVAVYVVYEVILRRGLPGIDEPPKAVE